MKCPTCNGEGYLLNQSSNPLFKRIEFYDCGGTGDINKPTENYCPACGEQIAINKKWCDFHKNAEEVSC
ncbi:MAG: hypothetical protein ACRCT1_13125 [Microcoleaceae cyanobacterium]